MYELWLTIKLANVLHGSCDLSVGENLRHFTRPLYQSK